MDVQGIQIDSNAREILDRIAWMPGKIRRCVRTSLGRGLLLVETRVRRRTRIKSRRGSAGIMGRLTSHTEETSTMGIDGAIGFRKRRGFPYEIAQEEGAHARAGGAMAIPVSPRARSLSDRGISARDFPAKLFRPKGTNVLMEAAGIRTFARTGKAGTLHYVLVKKIQPRLRFRQTVLASRHLISNAIAEGVAKGESAA